MLEHGGRLLQVARQYERPLHDWVDLSTGINPHGWPVPALPAEEWLRLPEEDDGLEQIACTYYLAPAALAVAGSQAAIQALPKVRRQQSGVARVAVLQPSYQEHAHHWQQAGHQLLRWSHTPPLAEADVVVVLQPNNPTGACWSAETLLTWHAQLAARGGWLVVDEAFIDTSPEASLTPWSHLPGLVVLRSVGKFFGLAGARLGFVLAEPSLLARLRAHLGLWPISRPSRWVGRQALADTAWQATMRLRLPVESARLASLLHTYGLPSSGGSSLFQWVCLEHAKQVAQVATDLAKQGILVRVFAEPASLRIGLPATELAWSRLTEACAQLAVSHKLRISRHEKA